MASNAASGRTGAMAGMQSNAGMSGGNLGAMGFDVGSAFGGMGGLGGMGYNGGGMSADGALGLMGFGAGMTGTGGLNSGSGFGISGGSMNAMGGNANSFAGTVPIDTIVVGGSDSMSFNHAFDQSANSGAGSSAGLGTSGMGVVGTGSKRTIQTRVETETPRPTNNISGGTVEAGVFDAIFSASGQSNAGNHPLFCTQTTPICQPITSKQISLLIE